MTHSLRVIAATALLMCGWKVLAFGAITSLPAISGLNENANVEIRYAPGGRVHGWEFIANSSFTVTHLGLFDVGRDGFNIRHPMGLFRSRDQRLLTQSVMAAGESGFLRNGFRYTDTPDASIEAGEKYVVCFLTATINGGTQGDGVIVRGDEMVSPVLTITQSGWYGANSYLGFPYRLTNLVGYPDLIGPSFLYSIPEPGTITLASAVFANVAALRRRRRSC